MQRAKCLMTDLTPSVTERCREALEAREIEVKVCEKNGSVLLEEIRRERPQLVFMEAFMPGLDALSIKQRCDAEGLDGTVFFVTGSFADDRLESEMAKHGIAFYFLKPFDPAVLAARRGLGAGAGCAPLRCLGRRVHGIGNPARGGGARASQGLPLRPAGHPAHR